MKLNQFAKDCLIGLTLLISPHILADALSSAQQIAAEPVFITPLTWVGKEPPTEAESAALLNAINVLKSGGISVGFTAFEEFLVMYPQSEWSPNLEVNLAEYYRNQGRYTPALAHWEAAWNATRNGQDAASQKTAVRAIAGWTRLLASLGETKKLDALFADLQTLQLPLGVYATTIGETKEGLAMMEARPGISYRCGSYALGHMANALGLDKQIGQRLFAIDSPDGGFHLSQLLKLAETNGITVAAVRRPVGAEIVVPSVVHWKLNHYAAITAKKGNLYRVEDPTFEGHVWMDAATIDEEAGGEFLVPKDKVPVGWQPLTSQECILAYGKGYPNHIKDHNDFPPPQPCDPDDDDTDDDCDPPAANDGASNSGGTPKPPPCPDCGMPQWTVSEPYISLWLTDTPLSYHQSNGKAFKLHLSYRSRGDAQNSQSSGFGDKWSCNLLGMMQSQSTNMDSMTDFRAGGGQEPFALSGALSYKTARKMILSPGSPPIVVNPVGAQNTYGFAVGDLTGNTNYYLTQRLDRYGRKLQQINIKKIGSVALVTNVLDIDGLTNTLTYGNSTYSNLITAVTDPYGAVAHFNYNANGLLTNIVDAQGMSTYFQYDSNENITNMVTPYGTNGFQYYSGQDTNDYNAVVRSLLITEPIGTHQYYVYEDHPKTDFGYRASYHWNRAQYAAITDGGQTNALLLTAADCNNAPVKNWLHADSDADGSDELSDTMAASADPLNPVLNDRANWTVYYYAGESGDVIDDGSDPALKRVVEIDRDGVPLQITRNNLGRPTSYKFFNTLNYYSVVSSALYTNIFDASGTILKIELGPRGELVRGYGYDPVLTNLLVSVTNAAGDVVRYIHDPSTLKVTSIIFPGGLIRTNIYYASGPNKGFLQQQIDIGFRTNSFAYTNGNLSIKTNELGLVTTYLYDSLNRLVSTGYPDGTTVSNVWNKLEIGATKDRLNQWAYYGYNAVRQLVVVTNENNEVTTYDYCGCGSPDEIVRWNGTRPIVTQFSYNMGGKLTNAIYADGYQLNYTYDFYDHIQTITDGNSNQVQYSYFQHGLDNHVYQVSQGSTTDPYYSFQQMSYQQYDEYGRVTNSTDRNGVITVESYDFLNRMTNRQALNNGYDNAAVGPENFAYNSVGLTNYSDQLGHRTKYIRDALGRVLYQTNGNNEVQGFTYNPSDEMLALTDGKNQTTTWAYDSYGRVTNKLDALGTNVFRYQYDPNDRLTNRWCVVGSNTVYRYDPIGNLTNIVYFSSSNVVLQYDTLNRLTNMVDGVGSTAFSWTDGDQLSGETGPWAGDAVNYSYNAARQRQSLSLAQPNASPWVQTYNYDLEMRLHNLTSPAGEFNYGYYFPAGNLVGTIQSPNAYWYGNAYSYYDGLGRLTETSFSASGYSSTDVQFQYGYDMGSELTQRTNTATNYMTYTYDNIGQLKTAQGWEPDNVTRRAHEQFGYAYDAAWNLSQRTNNALVQSFGVNRLNELTNATHSGTLTVAGNTSELRYPDHNPGVSSVLVSGTSLASASANLYIDGTWARTNVTPSVGNNTYTAIAQDSYGRLDTNSVTANLPTAATYSYDLNGNLLSDGNRYFAYDNENELTSVWVTNNWRCDFVYDGLLRRRIERDYGWSGSAWTQTNEVHYVYDGNLVIQERNASNVPLVTYTRGSDVSGSFEGADGVGGLLARTDNGQFIAGSSSANAYYFFDGKGNVAGLVNTNGQLVAQYDYDPFGNLMSMSGPLAAANTYRFSSKEWNENAGLYYYGYRFYDPNLQRFINRDPIQEYGGFNLFAFAFNQPTDLYDLYGLCPTSAEEGAGAEGEAAESGLAEGAAGEGAAGLGVADLGPIAAAGAIGYAAGTWLNNHTPIGRLGNWIGNQLTPLDPPNPASNNTAPDAAAGTWGLKKGAREWAKRNGVDPDDAQRYAHRTAKGGDNMSQATDDYDTDPDTGEIKDPEGNPIDNLNDKFGC